MMETNKGMVCPSSTAPSTEGEMQDVRRGPWTVEEDLVLVNYIENHGEGRWNSLARSSGLKRTGKSCRLRWLNYLRPDVRRGNITSEEQLLILELQSRWGNRWSKIAQYLPGRTDNEIKNYWRTRVQKHAKQLRCDVNSKKFQDVMRYLWIPRLLERIRAASSGSSPTLPVCPGNSQPNPCPEEHFGSETASTWLSSPPTWSDSVADCFSVPDGDTNCGDRIETTEINGNEWSDIASPNYYFNPRPVDLDNGNLGGDVGGSLWTFEDIYH